MLESTFISFLGLRGAVNRFAPYRADFYLALADRIELNNSATLLDIFRNDAQRYSADEDGNPIVTARGFLSEHWANKLLESGGDLASAFQGTVPQEDVSLLRLAQESGAGALPATLRDLSRMTGLIQRAKSIFYGTTVTAVLAVVVVLIALVATPLFTAPTLKGVYAGLPAEYYPPIATKLFATADFIAATLLALLVVFFTAVYFVLWSLPNLTGPLRAKLDKWLIWQLYRDFQGALFLAVLSTMTKKRGNVSTTLESALLQIREGASPWKEWHITQMLENLSGISKTGSGHDANIVEALNTGMVDRDSFFYLLDVFEAHGVAKGLLKAGERVEGPTLKMVESRAKWVSRLLMLFSICVMVTWGYAHVASATQFGKAMQTYYQSR